MVAFVIWQWANECVLHWKYFRHILYKTSHVLRKMLGFTLWVRLQIEIKVQNVCPNPVYVGPTNLYQEKQKWLKSPWRTFHFVTAKQNQRYATMLRNGLFYVFKKCNEKAEKLSRHINSKKYLHQTTIYFRWFTSATYKCAQCDQSITYL